MQVLSDDCNLILYMAMALPNLPYDFKEQGLDKRGSEITRKQHHYRGSVDLDGNLGSARDFGNITAGIMAGKSGLSETIALLGFDALESIQKIKLTTEGPTSKAAQLVGISIGTTIKK